MPDQDSDAGTIVSAGEVLQALNQVFGHSGMTFTPQRALKAAQSATGKIGDWTNRRWLPKTDWTRTYNAPPSSRLHLKEEVQADTLSVIAYDAELNEGTDYNLIYNERETAVVTLERLGANGLPLRWDDGHNDVANKIIVAGTAYYGAAPAAVITAARQLSVLEYLRQAQSYAGGVGPGEQAFDMVGYDDTQIQKDLKPWTRFVKRQIQRTGTD